MVQDDTSFLTLASIDKKVYNYSRLCESPFYHAGLG
jgi:hypothetical protein